LLRYSNGKLTMFTEADGAPHGFVEDLYLDDQHRLWVGTVSGGASCIGDTAAVVPKFVNYSTANGLSSNQVDCIIQDKFGAIYFGTGRGVDKLDPASGRLAHYTTADGLASSLIIVAHRTKDGSLWFGTQEGLSRLVPQPDKPASPPPIVVESVRIAGVEFPLSELASTRVLLPDLASTKNNVEIGFAGLSLAVGEALRYQYKLIGTSSDWSAPTDQRFVNYPNLPPGSYQFLVRAISTSGMSSPSPASVSFTINPPIWRRWWFISSAILLIGFAIYMADRYRVARLLELERVRTRIATDLHDDIGASLSRMAILSEVVKQETGPEDGSSAGMLTEIADSARGLVDSMSDIVWSIDPSKDDLPNLISRVRAFASDVLEPQGIHWELAASEGLEKIKLSPDQRRHIFLIFKEAINNIARHSGCDNARLKVTVAGGDISVEIGDDGQGIPSTPSNVATRGGNGLKNMDARVKELGGNLTLESPAGGGTLLRFTASIK
jgi:two-component sensor histidine kinase